MKSNFVDKFLFAGFKFGKIFASIVLVLLVITMIVCAVLLLKFDNTNISIPKFDTVVQAIEQQDADYSHDSSEYVSTKVLAKEAVEKKYSEEIEEIINELNLKPFAFDLFVSNIAKYDKEYQDKYVKGLKPFFEQGIAYIKDKYGIDMNNVQASKSVLVNLFLEYNNLFDSEINRVVEAKAQSVQNKIITASVLGSAILLFVLCLFLPLLIKIEENTRQNTEVIGNDKDE